jgi:transcriptional regulator with XRE-family HTH domain
MITGMQIRMGRQALRWSVSYLSDRSGISTSTIKRIEILDGLPNSTKANILAIKSALEAAGIEFTGTPEDLPGVRMNLAKKNAATS